MQVKVARTKLRYYEPEKQFSKSGLPFHRRRNGPRTVIINPPRVDFYPFRVKFYPQRVDFYPFRVKFYPQRVDFYPFRVKFYPQRVDFYPFRVKPYPKGEFSRRPAGKPGRLEG